MKLKKEIQAIVDKYYDRKMNIVQIFRDPNMEDRGYVVRFEDENGNWCCVLNLGYIDYPIGDDPVDTDDTMIEDGVDLEPGQKISKKMFGALRFF